MAGKLLKHFMLLTLLELPQGNIISECGTGDSYWEVQEGKTNNTFTCTGLSAQDTIQWFSWYSNSSVSYRGSCPPRTSEGSPFVCDTRGKPVFMISRTSDDTGVMVINATAARDSSLFDKGRLQCQAYQQGMKVGEAGCRLDYIHAGENTACTIQFQSDTWSVFGQCTTQKAYSTQNRYRCEWFQMKESPREEIILSNISMTTVTLVDKYVSGMCNFTSYLPPDGQYTYHVTVVPGEVGVTARFNGSNIIRRPSSPINHTCPQYVPEGGNLTCTCSTSDLGSPPGSLKWNTSQSAQLYVSDVKASASGTHTCQLLWNNTVTMSVEYTLNVAYGPKNVTLKSNVTLQFDTNGTQTISLSCTAFESNPPANITWIRSDNKSNPCNNELCVLIPKPPDDDGMKLECQAKNPVTNGINSRSITVSLNYPPTSLPEIIGNPGLNSAQPVYEGDSIALTCTVRGGKPANATVIKFTCPNKNDTLDSSLDTSTITSNLTFESVSSSNHGNCTCSAQWKNYDWYSKKVSWVLKVYTPPSIPIIFAPSDSTGHSVYPFMAGASGSLSCRSNQTGRPEATYTWPVPATGHASGSNLTFFNLSKEDNGRKVTCTASNNYTENRRPVDNATFVLEVYYKPSVTFIGVSNDNNCSIVFRTSNYSQCVVAEGQKVRINCTADSNPAPALFKWSSPVNDFYSNTNELVIMSANHTIHNGDYNCTVITKQVNNDDRLPLTSSAIFSIIVGYSPRGMNFSINNENNINVTVEESSTVNMKCLVNGRPTPSIRLINANDPKKVLNQSQPTGDISVEEQVGDVSLSINQVPCEDSGIYACEANNDLGLDSQNRTLLVSCAPRGSYYDGVPPAINALVGKGELSLRMIALPTPVVKKMNFLGVLNDSYSTVTERIMSAACFASPWTPANVTCSISVYNITQKEEGFYEIVFDNGIGAMPFTFFVKAAPIEESDPPVNIPAIIGGIVAALVFIIILSVAVVFLKRRAGNGSQSKLRSDHHPKTNESQTADGKSGLQKSGSKDHSSINQQNAAGGTSPYERLQLEDVGNRSQYEELQRYQNSSASSPCKTSPLYEALQVQDVGKRSDYEELQRYQNASAI